MIDLSLFLSPEEIANIPLESQEEQGKARLQRIREDLHRLIPIPCEPYPNQSHYDFLRTQSRIHIIRDVLERIAVNPNFTPEERNLGTFTEVLEPQVRGAVMDLRRKGYQTCNSGFGGIQGEFAQMIEIRDMPSFPAQVAERLNSLGVSTYSLEGNDNVTGIAFLMGEDDTLETLKEKWDRIAKLLPATQKAGRLNSAWQLKSGFTVELDGLLEAEESYQDIKTRKQKMIEAFVEDPEYEFHFPRLRSVLGKIRRIVVDFEG